MALRLKWTVSIITVLVLINETNSLMRSYFGSNTSNEDPQSYELIELNKRGQFERLKWSTETLESLNISDTAPLTAAAISKQIRCNDAFYMVSYLQLTNPKYFSYPDQVESLHVEIKTAYPEWARKILMTAFNVAQNDSEMDVPWLFYMHVKRIELHAANDPDEGFLPAMQNAHKGMYKVLSSMMSDEDCTTFDQSTIDERKFPKYVADIQQPGPCDFSGNSIAVFGLLSKHWPVLCLCSSLGCLLEHYGYTGPVPGVQPLRENHLTLDLLNLNDVFESKEATGQLMKFGVFENGDELINYLKVKITEIKSGRTPFRQYVLALVDFHEHVQRAFHTMILRIYYDFMEKLKTLDIGDREAYVEQFFEPYNDWCVFFYLLEMNPLYVHLTPKSTDYDMYFREETILKLQQLVINNLIVIDRLSEVSMDNHTPESLRRIKIKESQLKNIARVHQIPLDFGYETWLINPVRETIMCAKVLIGFVRKMFDNINFKALRSLVKLRKSTNLDRFE